MNDGSFKIATYHLLAEMLPTLENEKIKKLAEEEFCIIKKACATQRANQIRIEELLSVIYLAVREALAKFDESRKIAIDSYIKYITKMRAKDFIRKWNRDFETNHFVPDLKFNDAMMTTYEYNVELASLKDYNSKRKFEDLNALLQEHFEKSEESVKTKCFKMLYNQFSDSDIKRILKLKRRHFEALRKEFLDYVRNYWNYDNIY